MSHAAPSCAGFAPRHTTFGVTTQKFGIGEPRSFGHPVGAAGIDEDGKPVRSANKKGNAGLQVLERNMSVHETRVVDDHATRAEGQRGDIDDGQGDEKALRVHDAPFGRGSAYSLRMHAPAAHVIETAT